MVVLLTMTGGVSLAGTWMYRRLDDKKRDQNVGSAWWQTPWRTVQETLQRAHQRFTQHTPLVAVLPRVDEPALAFDERRERPSLAIHYGLHAATLALGLTTAGRFFYPPLQIAGLPLLVYMGIPAAKTAHDQLWVDGRPSRALAETVALAVCLAGGYYWVGSLGFWLYYGSRRLLAEPQPDVDVPHQETWIPTTTHVWQAGTSCTVPTATLRQGDHVLLHSGELAPVDGLITEGVAWLRPQALSVTASALRKAVGDRVVASDLVLVGRICMRVLPPE